MNLFDILVIVLAILVVYLTIRLRKKDNYLLTEDDKRIKKE